MLQGFFKKKKKNSKKKKVAVSSDNLIAHFGQPQSKCVRRLIIRIKRRIISSQTFSVMPPFGECFFFFMPHHPDKLVISTI